MTEGQKDVIGEIRDEELTMSITLAIYVQAHVDRAVARTKEEAAQLVECSEEQFEHKGAAKTLADRIRKIK